MATWNLLHMRSPLNTTAGTGQYRELSRASGRKFTFATEDFDTLSFDMPGNDPQTASITPLVDDVLAFRDNVPVQRFRVVTRAMSKDSGVLQASFTAVSYRALLNAWIFHDKDTRSWPTATEQTAIAWTVISEGQARQAGSLGISRGILPLTPVTRSLAGSIPEGGTRPEYFQAGMTRGEALNNVAVLDNGFEWDIEPDPADPYRALKFNAWNLGGRNRHVPRSPLVLDDGGSMASWSHTVTPSDYLNVLRFTGSQTTDANSTTKAVPIVPAWVNENTFPAIPPEGRWERDINDSDLTTQAAVNSRAPATYNLSHVYVPEISCTLKRGKWEGPSQLWLGDQASLVINEKVRSNDGRPLPSDAPEYVIYIDENVRIVEITVDVDNQGAEDLTLSINRPRLSSKKNTRTVNDRLNKLERR